MTTQKLNLYSSVPSSYLHALDCYVNAKQEYLAKYSSKEVQALSILYDYQRKYINALLKQLPAGTSYPAPSRTVTLHPPQTLKHRPRRQGPFLLQPAPRELSGSNFTDATDIVYLSFGNDGVGDEDNERERLGLVVIASQDGKVDVCLDVDKVEARWDTSKVMTDKISSVHPSSFVHRLTRNGPCWPSTRLSTLAYWAF